MEEHDRVLKTIYEQHVVLAGNLQVLHETADNTACGTKEGPVSVFYLAGVDSCIEDV